MPYVPPHYAPRDDYETVILNSGGGNTSNSWVTDVYAYWSRVKQSGLLPDEAAAQGLEVITSVFPFAANGRAPEAREWAEPILRRKATMPEYIRRRERPWFRKAAALLKRVG